MLNFLSSSDFLKLSSFGAGEFLVVVDTYSRIRFPVFDVFKLCGLPVAIQSDNGPPFRWAAVLGFW